MVLLQQLRSDPTSRGDNKPCSHRHSLTLHLILKSFMRERPALAEDVSRDQKEEGGVEGHHVNSVLAQDTDWDMKHSRMNMEGLKGDRGLRVTVTVAHSLSSN